MQLISEIKTLTYAFSDTIYVDIVEDEENYDVWGYFKGYGFKSHLFGVPKTYFNNVEDKQIVNTLNDVIEMAEIDLTFGNAIKLMNDDRNTLEESEEE